MKIKLHAFSDNRRRIKIGLDPKLRHKSTESENKTGRKTKLGEESIKGSYIEIVKERKITGADITSDQTPLATAITLGCFPREFRLIEGYTWTAEILPYRVERKENRTYTYQNGSIIYSYWPKVKLGYVDHIEITSELRKKGYGMDLLKFAMKDLGKKEAERILTYSVSQEGYGLLTKYGFLSYQLAKYQLEWFRWLEWPDIKLCKESPSYPAL